MQIQRDTVIEADAFVIDRVAANEAETERNDFAVLSPEKEPRVIRHSLSNGTEIIFGQRLKFQWGSLVDGQIQWIDLVDQTGHVVQYFHLDFRSALCFAKLSTQIFACRFAECLEIFVPIFIRE